MSVFPGNALGQIREYCKPRCASCDEDKCFVGKRGKEKPQDNDGPEVIHEACAEDALAEFRTVETGLEHDRIDHGHGRGRECYTGKETG